MIKTTCFSKPEAPASSNTDLLRTVVRVVTTEWSADKTCLNLVTNQPATPLTPSEFPLGRKRRRYSLPPMPTNALWNATREVQLCEEKEARRIPNSCGTSPESALPPPNLQCGRTKPRTCIWYRKLTETSPTLPKLYPPQGSSRRSDPLRGSTLDPRNPPLRSLHLPRRAAEALQQALPRPVPPPEPRVNRVRLAATRRSGAKGFWRLNTRAFFTFT